jgi:hypothetical protein
VPFCQLLTAEGQSVVYISPHGQREQGKDVISIGSDRTPSAYQLKGGRLALSDWRKFKGEIDELVEYPIDYPGITNRRLHRPYLVTNGSVSDAVLSAVRSANAAWKRRKHPALQLIVGSELVIGFVSSHGSYLPREPKNFKLFLELVLESGKSPLDKAKFARFLESVLPLRTTQAPAMREIHRAVASATLLSSYILQSCELEKNWWAIFEGWVLTASYCAALSCKYSAKEHWWESSFKLCELAATRALDNLCQECRSNDTQLIEGDPLTDGHFYPYRVTILLGLLSALNLYRLLRGETRPEEDFLRRFLKENIKNVRMWGESTIPLFVETGLQLEKFGDQWMAENLMVQLIDGITRANSRQDRGLPDPYFGAEDSLRLLYQLDKDNPAELSRAVIFVATAC